MGVFGSRAGAAVLTFVCGIAAAQAASFGIYDPRSMAMGGTGVSPGTGSDLSYFNPALLAMTRPKGSFALEVTAAARVLDPQNLRDDIDRLETTGTNLESAITQFNQSQSTANASSLATALGSLRSVLTTVNNKTAEANAFASPIAIGVPGRNFGWAVHASARVDVGARLTFAQSDSQLLLNYQAAAAQYAGSGQQTDLDNLLNQFGNGTQVEEPAYQSFVDVRGIAMQEYGISMAREFETNLFGNVALGVTPKYVKVQTFDYRVNPDDDAEIDADKGRSPYVRNWNVDLGFAKNLGSGFKMGVVGKNLVSRSYTTVLGNTIEIKPNYRAGIAHVTPRTTLAMDVDLNENQGVAFGKPTQFLGVGAELHLWVLQLRAGYRADLTGNYKGIPSLGVGFSLLGLHIDAAAAKRGEEEVSAALQLSLRF